MDSIVSAIGISPRVSRIMISATTQRHIIKRRQLVNKLDVELCARRLAEAIENVVYLLQPQRDPRVYEIVCTVPSANRRVLIALKHVKAESARSEEDELWIRTAHPFGKRNYKRKKARGELLELLVQNSPIKSAQSDA